MIKLVLTEIIEAIAGQVRGEPAPISVTGVSTDSRTIAAGELFFALRGENFDGHAFVSGALQRGAVAAVIEAARAEEIERALSADGAARPGPAVLIRVDDPLAALGRLAHFHRRQLSATVIAVVGSNGKTTTKAMIHHVLGARLTGRCSPKSFNNAIGVPLTLLSAQQADDYVVVEIGTNCPGEVEALGRLAAPDQCVITSIGAEHLERLGDLEGVAEEECSVLRTLSPGGFAAVNADAPLIRPYLATKNITIASFGFAEDADLRLTETRYEAPWLRFVLNGRFAYRLELPGSHNAVNAAGAVTIARRFGLSHEDVAARLESFVLPPMRNEMIRIAGVTLVNDAYNANPSSAEAAIQMFETLPASGRKIVVFGEMRELGPRSPAEHRRIADRLRTAKVDHVLLVGSAGEWMIEPLAQPGLFGPAVERCEDVPACAERLSGLLREGDIVLLKASRAVQLDRVVEPLRRRMTPAPVA